MQGRVFGLDVRRLDGLVRFSALLAGGCSARRVRLDRPALWC